MSAPDLCCAICFARGRRVLASRGPNNLYCSACWADAGGVEDNAGLIGRLNRTLANIDALFAEPPLRLRLTTTHTEP